MNGLSSAKKKIVLYLLCLPLTACFSGSDKDSLRSEPAESGVFLGLQANLPAGEVKANVAASIYYDGVKQPLVGGDLFLASSENAADQEALKSLENLSGNYLGTVTVADITDTVTIETVYDPELAREDRWYPIDELLVDPGPNKVLQGYSQDFAFPQAIENLTIASGSSYSSRAQSIDLTWTPGDGDQMHLNGIVNCVSTGGQHYNYAVSRFYAGDTGAVSPLVSDFIPNDTLINTVGTIAHEILTILSAALLEVYTFGLIDSSDIEFSTFELSSCDVDLTVFREVGLPVPAGTEGGSFAIASTSDTVSFTYNP